MKKLLFVFVALVLVHNSYSQWTGTTTNNNVGIGELNPTYKLDIINQSNEGQQLFRARVNGAASDYFKLGNATLAIGTFVPMLYGYQSSNDTKEAFYTVGAISALTDVGSTPVTVFDSRRESGIVSNRPLFAWDSYGNRKMTLSASGSLGIGTAAPTARLHVFHPTAACFVNIDKPNSTQEGGVRFSNNGSPIFYFWSDNDDNDALKIEADGLPGENDGAPRMEFPRINKNIYMAESGGNVGIGTTDPKGFKLAVNGKIWTQEVNVAMINPGPDYVFEKDYNLLPLSELETYITKNKHLPEVPSAKEMEADGLNLKEMNLILLKKVEELTLHLIEQSKEIKSVR